jgi:predicted esterase
MCLPAFAGENDWAPSETLTINDRKLEVIKHGVKKEWGYEAPQTDTFMVVHPKVERENAPLYVVLHSAGHDVKSCVECTRTVGNHDIYHSPDDFYALYVDCRANKGDWWWGGMHAKDQNLIKKNSGGDPMPVEKRVMDTVRWTIGRYKIDANRVYLCGNSMGGSGTLGIGMRNGDIFAAIKANVPAGIEHVSNRMYFPPQEVPGNVKIPDPPVVIDYSAQNDGWSFGHERFVKAVNDRKYALYFYWGPFGHANNHANIMKVNDLVNSFDWLTVKKNEAYPVFCNASCNDKMPWPDNLGDKASGQVNAFFRWKNISDTKNKVEMSLFLAKKDDLKTTSEVPKEATADVSLRRVQNMRAKPGETFKWTFGAAKGEGRVDAGGLITVPGLKITADPVLLTVSR